MRTDEWGGKADEDGERNGKNTGHHRLMRRLAKTTDHIHEKLRTDQTAQSTSGAWQDTQCTALSILLPLLPCFSGANAIILRYPYASCRWQRRRWLWLSIVGRRRFLAAGSFEVLLLPGALVQTDWRLISEAGKKLLALRGGGHIQYPCHLQDCIKTSTFRGVASSSISHLAFRTAKQKHSTAQGEIRDATGGGSRLQGFAPGSQINRKLHRFWCHDNNGQVNTTAASRARCPEWHPLMANKYDGPFLA
ncbi:hypothetical protein B0T19DRAFT_399369 [Cercophora scortea]|uniref:Uncharacterized protein n=1 Tax=Cercophora scortea TaxID=314031 RepID=A0AAE0IYR0_9PEZI|nr:hypothetical protein B0T19DRAFT_399369 [Cercophora scortea]